MISQTPPENGRVSYPGEQLPQSGAGNAATPTVLLSFNGANGADPAGTLLLDAAGDVIGTTSEGGAYGHGTIYELPKIGADFGAPVTLATLSGGAIGPNGGLVADAAGNLFGTAAAGGPADGGSVFELPRTATGYGALAILPSFNGSDGAEPLAAPTLDAAGDLFGTTAHGGATNDGTVFEVPHTAAGYGAVFTLVSFNGVNGSIPVSSLTLDPAGNLVGTTVRGGSAGTRVVFTLAAAGVGYSPSPTVLASFSGANGAYANGGLRVGPRSYSALAKPSQHQAK